MQHIDLMQNPPDYQIKILENSGANFAIFAINLTTDNNHEKSKSSGDIFYLDYDETFPYIHYFLEKNFKTSLQHIPPYFSHNGKWEIAQDEFNWYDENYYTFEQIHLVLKDIKHHIDLLINDFDNPMLENFKKLLIIQEIDYEFIDSFYPNLDFSELSEAEKTNFIKNHLFIIIDFYQRVVTRIEKMMNDNPTFNHICFSGP